MKKILTLQAPLLSFELNHLQNFKEDWFQPLKKTLRCSTNRFFQILAPSGGTYQHECTYFRMRMHHFFTVLFDQIFFYDKTYLLHTMFLDFAKNLVGKEFKIFIYIIKTRGILKQLGLYKSIFQVGQIAKKCLRR